MSRMPLRLWEAFGIELEYMIVEQSSLDVLPITDRLFQALSGSYDSEIERGEISCSNELALHVVELKTTEPTSSFARLPQLFQEQVAQINHALQGFQGRLLPTAMHPWMDPNKELRLWPHEYNAVYEAYNRIFDCRGHGWANLQSVHLNLPFADDEEFGRLHAAIRLLLPLLPALAASSPMMDGRITGIADNRMEVYRGNSRRIPELTGEVVPEPVFSQADYQREIFQPMFDAIAPFDPARILRGEWLNSRGAIARFDRGAIEIRVLDVQEHPAADVAICELIVSVLQRLVEEKWTSYDEQRKVPVTPLAAMLRRTICDAEHAIVDAPELLSQFGMTAACTAGELWCRLYSQVSDHIHHHAPLEVILERGTLSRRITTAVRSAGAATKDVYLELADCLAESRLFLNTSSCIN